jgi:hypothetical protein
MKSLFALIFGLSAGALIALLLMVGFLRKPLIEDFFV